MDKRTEKELQNELNATLAKLKTSKLSITYVNIAKVENITSQWAHKKYSTLSSHIEELKSNETITQAQELAAEKGGECVSEVYTTFREKLYWKCHDHTHLPFALTLWQVGGLNRWCPECKPIRLGRNPNPEAITLARHVAHSHGGQCLSTEYKRTDRKLEWKCANSDHPSWFAYYGNVVGKGCWCRKCSREKKATNGGK